MNRRFTLLLSVFLLCLGGCGVASSDNDGTLNDTETPESENATEQIEPSPSPELETPDSAEVVDPAFLISENGLGLAQLGMTFGELKQILPPDVEYIIESPFIVDFDAIAVQQAGDVQFYILYFAGDTFSDDAIIQGLMTENSAYQTAQGVGVDTPIQTAEESYGDATLSYSWANEGREYVRFENPPAVNLAFRVWRGDTPSTDFVGVYPSSSAEYNETQEYIDDAVIKAILVSCIAEDCAS
ncbi:MAG: hypothetical protein AAGA75_23760 [Cyanobacteria bacterium P01_E01_bin.6]